MITTDLRADALAMAEAFGADQTVDVRETPLAEALRRAGSAAGADVVIDSIGTAGTVAAALAAVRVGGRVAVSGLGGTEPLALDLIHLVRNKIALVGSYGTHTRAHLPALLDVVAQGALDPTALITERFAAADADAAYGAVADGKVRGRALIEF